MTSRRERFGWALLFGLPMGVGVGLATARTAGVGLADPLVVSSGSVVAVVVAALVVAGERDGSGG